MSLKIKCAKCNCIMVEKDEKLFCDYCDTTREIPERLVHIVTSSYGEDYNQTIDKIFLSENKANKYKNDYNVQLITKQTQEQKCMDCPFQWGKDNHTSEFYEKEQNNYKCYKESEDKECCINSDRLVMALEQYPAEVNSYEIQDEIENEIEKMELKSILMSV